MELDGPDLEAYRMPSLRAISWPCGGPPTCPAVPLDSAKLGRLVEIVEEAASNGRKVVVFSYFRDVLETVASVLGAMAVGPLTGSTPPIHRQAWSMSSRRAEGPPPS